MKNTPVLTHHFEGEEKLDEYIRQQDERIVQKALATARSLAETTVSQEEISHFCNALKTEYEEVMDYVRRFFLGDVHRVSGNLERKISDTEIGLNEQHIHKQSEEARNAKIDRDRIGVKWYWKYFKVFVIGEILILLSDCLYNIISFTVLGGSVLFAIPGALIFSACLGIAAYKIPAILKAITNPGKRIWYAIGFAFAMLIFIIPVSFLRAAMTVGNGTLTSLGAPVVILAAIIFTILQFGIFIILCLGVWCLPSEQELMAQAKWESHDKEHKKLTGEVETLKARNRALPVDTLRLLTTKAVIIEKEKAYCRHIESLSKRTVNAFIHEYLLRKRRGQPPLLS